MSAIEKAILQIQKSATGQCNDSTRPVDARIQIIVVLAFMVTTLSISVDDPAKLLWLFCFPIIMSEAMGIGYNRLFTKSLLILPLLILIGICNPILDTATVWVIGPITIDRGWLTFGSLVLRGMLTFQALLLLIDGYGFYDICRCLQKLHCPKVLVTQLLMLHRYIGVMLREALNMQHARQARGYGREHYPLKMWGVFAGQLFIRSVERARRVHNAMVSRGFTGVYYFSPFTEGPKIKDYIYLAIWIGIFAAIRFINLTSLVGRLFISG